MIKYLRNHEKWLREQIRAVNEGKDKKWKDVLGYNCSEIMNLQHERLLHLILTMFVGLFLMITFALLMFSPRLEVIVLLFILLVLFGFYIRHYFQLENGVQGLYKLSSKLHDEIDKE